MKRKLTFVTLLVFALSMMVGVVGAQETEETDEQRPILRATVGQVVQVVAEQTDLTAREILQGLSDGSTLAEIIEDAGGDLVVVIEAVETQLITAIETAQENGRITEEQAMTLMDNLPETIDTVLNTVPELGERVRDGNRNRVRGQVMAVFVQNVMDETGLTLPELLDAMSGEMTLAEIIEANGGSVDVVVDGVIEQITETANERVASGDITQEQADTVIDGLDEVLTNWLEGDFEFELEGRRGNRGNRGGN